MLKEMRKVKPERGQRPAAGPSTKPAAVFLLSRRGAVAAAAMAGAIALSTLLPQAGRAAEFKLVEGGQFELCRRYAENLALFSKLPRWPCEIPLDRRFSEFREVPWEALDPGEHLDVVEEIVKRLLDRKILLFDHFIFGNEIKAEDRARENQIWQRARPEIMAKIEAGEVGLGRARIDLNHDGAADTVYRFGRSRCEAPYPEPHRSFYWTYHVLERDEPFLSAEMRLHAQDPYDAFYHRGRIYFARPVSGGGLLVMEPQMVRNGNEYGVIRVCDFETLKQGDDQ